MIDNQERNTTALSAYGELWNYPNVQTNALRSNAVPIGRSGEFLVQSILIRHGVACYYGGDFLGTDLRIQSFIGDVSIRVKTTTYPRLDYYRFTMRRGNTRSNLGLRPYDNSELAISALVILPLNAVYFTSDVSICQSVHTSSIPRLVRSPKESFLRALISLANRHKLDL